MEQKDCGHYENLFYETMERFLVTKEGFADLLQELVKSIEEQLERANEEHVMMPMVGVVLAQAAARVYRTLRETGVGKEEAREIAEAQMCGAYRYALKLFREMVESGVLDESPSSPATGQPPP